MKERNFSLFFILFLFSFLFQSFSKPVDGSPIGGISGVDRVGEVGEILTRASESLQQQQQQKQRRLKVVNNPKSSQEDVAEMLKKAMTLMESLKEQVKINELLSNTTTTTTIPMTTTFDQEIVNSVEDLNEIIKNVVNQLETSKVAVEKLSKYFGISTAGDLPQLEPMAKQVETLEETTPEVVEVVLPGGNEAATTAPSPSNCLLTSVGSEYVGTQSRGGDNDGFTCQRWDDQWPNAHTYTATSMFPDNSLAEASNYCRNPDNDPRGPWCLVTDGERKMQYCNIPMCPGTRSVAMLSMSDQPTGQCLKDKAGFEYSGTQNRGKWNNGTSCQRWDQQSPHKHPYTSSSMFPDDSLAAAANYCRNPNKDPRGPWCYSKDSKTIEYCYIPICNISKEEQLSLDMGKEQSLATPNLEYYYSEEFQK